MHELHHTESLRKYPPVTNLTRSCLKDYRVEGTNFVIKKDQMVFVPAISIHHDPEIFPNPSLYEPDRFLPEEQAKRSPYSFLSFGQGPRNCIGCELSVYSVEAKFRCLNILVRFGMMQAKIGLAMMLKNFKFEKCSRQEEVWLSFFL